MTVLERAAIPHALIGAAALAAHGISRSTIDLDLLVVEAACLDSNLWAGLRDDEVLIEIRRGDIDDPLAGVVRFTAPRERPVDLVVGRAAWQRGAVARAVPGRSGGATLPILRAADLILLKLFAGGPQDAWDIQQLLAAGDSAALEAEVERSLRELPAEATALWKRLL